jgi:predicted site-specific integrase-resolvase
MPNQQTSTESALAPPAWARTRLNVSRQTLLSYEALGKLHPVKLPSGHRRYLVDEVEALAGGVPATGEQETTSEAGDTP